MATTAETPNNNLAYGAFLETKSQEIFKEISSYFFWHLKKLCSDNSKETPSYIEEIEYIDKGFIIDYKNYYARCFEKIGKTTKRYHFFDIDKSSLQDIHQKMLELTANDDEIKLLKNTYLGSAVIRPLDNYVVGKTFIKPPDSSHITVLNKTTVNIAGESFSIDALPFQSQDKAVSACATIALWTSLQALDHKFGVIHTPAPSEISEFASSSGVAISATYPNNGLTLFQIQNALQKMGYQINCVENIGLITKKDPCYLNDYIKTYLEFGIPIIAVLTLNRKNHEKTDITQQKEELHSIVITGYTENADNTLTLFIHDDGIGPYVPIKFDSSKTCDQITYEFKENKWKESYDEQITLSTLIVPLYEKIRLNFPYMYNGILKNKEYTPQNLGASLYLYEINKYRKEIKNKNTRTHFSKQNKIDLLGGLHLPKYIWVIRVSYFDQETSKNIIFGDRIYDATTHIAKILYSAGNFV